jgi:hypothetical protein
MLTTLRLGRAIFVFTLACTVLLTNLTSLSAAPQDKPTPTATQTKRDDEVDLEIQIQVVIGTNGASDNTPLPTNLDTTLKQLRSTLRFNNFKMGATFLNRVKNGRQLEVRGVGSVVPLPQNPNPYTPSFYQFSLRPVELKQSIAGREMVSIHNLSFGMKVPVTTSRAGSSNNSDGQNFPVVQYEDTGIHTGVSMREGETVVVGTLYYGASGDAVIVLLTAKKIAL